MNRPIKFRGKRKGKNPEWVFGDLSQWPDGNCEITTFIDTGLVDHFGGGIFNVTRTEVHPSTVGQFAGLTDRNGTEIFEGDFLDAPAGMFEIKYINTAFVQSCIFLIMEDGSVVKNPLDPEHTLYSSGGIDNTEVVGNIHEPVKAE